MSRKKNQTKIFHFIIDTALVVIFYSSYNICLSQTSNINNKEQLDKNYIALNLNNIPDYSEESTNSTNPENSTKDELSKIVIPNSPSIIVKRNEFPIPFDLSPKDQTNPPIEIELLYTKVQNPHWISFGKVQAGSSEKAFQFKSEENGDFAFVLKTTFKDGTNRFCSPLKINIAQADLEKKNEIDAAKIPLPLLNTTPNNSSNSNQTLNNNSNTNQNNLQNSSGSSSNIHPNPSQTDASTDSSTEIDPFPGAIKTISYEYDDKIQTVIKIRWITPQDIGQEKGNGEVVQLERSKSQNGPWQIIANQLDCSEAGYQWVATPYDAEPFYLKSVTTDQYGKDWTYIFPKLIELSSILKFGNDSTESKETDSDDSTSNNPTSNESINETTASESSSDQSNIGLSGLSLPVQSEEEAPRPNKVQSWNDSPDIPTPNDNSSESPQNDANSLSKKESSTTVSKTSSTSTESTTASNHSPRKLFDVNFPQNPQQVRPNIPPPTNPSEFSVNPLFTQGLGVIFQAQQARNPNGYIESPSANNYSSQSPNIAAAETNSANRTPEPPKRRSIFALFNRQQESQIVPQQQELAQNSVRNIPTTGYQTQMNAFPPGQRSTTAEDGTPMYYDDGKGNLFDANGVQIDPAQIGQQFAGATNGNTMTSNNAASFIPNNSLDPMFNGDYNGGNYQGQNFDYSNYSGTDQGFNQGNFNQTSNLPLYYGDYPQEVNSYQNAPLDNQYGRNYSNNSLPQPGPNSSLRPNTRSILPPKPLTN